VKKERAWWGNNLKKQQPVEGGLVTWCQADAKENGIKEKRRGWQ